MSVVLDDVRETDKVKLPKTGGEVTLYKGLLYGDLEGLDMNDNIESGKKVLVRSIKEWNFVDKNDQQLEVSEENLKKLPMEDVVFMINKTKAFSEAQNKKKQNS